MTQYGGSSADPGAGAFISGISVNSQVINGVGLREIKDKTISYDATNSEEILNISTASGTLTTKEAIPRRVEIQNVGGVPLMIMAGYQEWSSETAVSGNPEYLHTMIMPGETYSPPVRAIIRTGESSVIMDGTVVDNDAPNPNIRLASGATLSADVDSSDTSINVDNGNFFRVGDLIQLGDDSATISKVEIMEVTGITDTAGDGAFTPASLAVRRGLYGSNINDKDAQTDGTDGSVSGANVSFPFFNAYYDYDKYTVVQTDSNGKFKCNNFFGLGRAGSGVVGLIPGSIAIKFYQPGYQKLGLSGITSSTNSGLVASTAYKIDITVDGGTKFQDLTFTTDTSNLNFGGTNGIISKIQSALDTQYYTSGNLFEKKVTVGIIGGDIRFTSGSHLSTSAILLEDTLAGLSFIDATANGRIPASGDIPSAVAARLPDDVSYDRITYATTPNTGAFGYDNGLGRLFGMCNGTINYETGAVDITGCPLNAEFVITCLHSSAFSGKLNEAATDRINSLVNVLANTTSQKWDGKVQTRIY